MKRRVSILIAWFGIAIPCSANWDAAPIDVHEWGVNTFDWNTGNPLVQQLPEYLYTDQKPGEAFPSSKIRVRDFPSDSGIRTKPILYFYPGPKRGRGSSVAHVGVEMRFAYGYANAWWPQVNRYRTEEESMREKAPDWEEWKKEALERYQNLFLKNNKDGKAGERWAAELERYNRMSLDQQVATLGGQNLWERHMGFPEDKRIQLAWENLTLSSGLLEGHALPGKDLPNDHWAKIAREVDAAYVSNGREAERYLFYEGKTREETAIALLPADGGARVTNFGRVPDENSPREVSLVNVGQHTIYDVMAIYRDRDKGTLWMGYLPVMNPRTVAMRIPDFKNPGEDDHLKLSQEDFRRRTTDRLIEYLTAGDPIVRGNVMGRDPAEAQGPTQRHQLFRKEAVGLEKIWHDDFFEADGLTVIYRESPAYLDEAMPLNIFTSMSWYIRLTRCGLVLNRNVPLEQVYQVDQAIWDFQLAGWNEHLKGNLKNAIPELKKNRLLTLGQARFYLESEGEAYKSQLDRIRKLFE